MICDFIENLYNILKMILSANATQTIILIATALITLHIYNKQNKQREQEAAAIIMLELKSIDKTVRETAKCARTDGKFDIQQLWNAVKAYNKNSWESYRQILLKYLSIEEINTINMYYKCVAKIDEQVDTFHKMIYATYESFYIERMMKSREKIEGEHPGIRTFPENLLVLNTNCANAISLFEALPISKLEKISKKR